MFKLSRRYQLYHVKSPPPPHIFGHYLDLIMHYMLLPLLQTHMHTTTYTYTHVLLKKKYSILCHLCEECNIFDTCRGDIRTEDLSIIFTKKFFKQNRNNSAVQGMFSVVVALSPPTPLMLVVGWGQWVT